MPLPFPIGPQCSGKVYDRFAHMSKVLHWVHIKLCICCKILFLVSKSQLGLGRNYLSDFLCTNLYVLPCFIRYALWTNYFFFPRASTTLTQSCAFALNNLCLPMLAILMSGVSSSSLPACFLEEFSFTVRTPLNSSCCANV